MRSGMDSSFSVEESERSTQIKRRCRGCGEYVTVQFVRVFGGNNDEVHACLACATMRELRAGRGVFDEG